mmetsp:Transcript_15605/g.18230  ORF Transcript_15605/g.18230 Transcript_15605/m.18230 type:complete len:1083 (-) Transcript_15605:2647-5895(-)
MRSLCSWTHEPQVETRFGYIGDGHDNGNRYRDNAVKTSKYTWYNFLFLNLFGQFRRVANVYFLIQGVIMYIGWYYPYIYQSPVHPWSTIGTLAFVLLVTLAKDVFEDIDRHRSDRRENRKLFTVVRNGKEIEIQSRRIQVGDWVKVRNREQFPADLVAVLTSDTNGQLFVETANIDGETNLKIRKPVKDFVDADIVPTSLPVGLSSFECDLPNKHIHHFNCTITCGSRKFAVSTENFLLRGSVLRNTSWIYGFVVYTGKDTKVMKNMTKAPSKMSRIEHTVNKIIFVIFMTQLILVVVSVAFSITINNNGREDTLAGGDGDSTIFPFWLAQCFSFFILYGQMVPISLYVTMELINVAQGYAINHDSKMMYMEDPGDPESIIKPECKDSKLCQEIGQIQYVFSDKTGTLTRNVMEFKKCAVDGQVFPNLESASKALRTKKTVNIDLFFRLLSTCHTVIPDYVNPEVTFESPELKYSNLLEYINFEAESPDEGALVQAAYKAGIAFVHRTPGKIVLLSEGQDEKVVYEILAINSFDSTRKRMSVIVRDSCGDIFLLCKGADSVIFEGSCDSTETKGLYDTILSSFANEGLRTLLVAVRRLTKDEFEAWNHKYKQAELEINNRDKALANVAAEIERDMNIIGATAIEDKLQEGVPETISKLADAGVKLWVLTGDKMETAINIGYSSEILTKEMRVFKLRCDSKDELESRLAELERLVDIANSSKLFSCVSGCFKFSRFEKQSEQQDVKSTLLTDVELALNFSPTIQPLDEQGNPEDDHHSFSSGSTENSEPCSKSIFAIVIDGNTFKFVSENAQLRRRFLRIGKLCKSVIACRVSPAQKAEFVGFFKHKVTLAIGDGANDVSMIQAARIGVGIKGKEGRQAVNASDFAIGQFRYLQRLLLLHGRWNYMRMAKVILLAFYKNAALVFTLFLYNFVALMSGVSLYDSFVYAGFNFFSGMPLLLLGIFDKDIGGETMLNIPAFYGVGREGTRLNFEKMLEWMSRGFVTALIVTSIPLLSYAKDLGVPTYCDQSNDISGIQAYGTFVYTALFFCSHVCDCVGNPDMESSLPFLFRRKLCLLFSCFVDSV